MTVNMNRDREPGTDTPRKPTRTRTRIVGAKTGSTKTGVAIKVAARKRFAPTRRDARTGELLAEGDSVHLDIAGRVYRLAVVPDAPATDEDAADAAIVAAGRAAVAAGEETVPAALLSRIVDGESPVRVWREHRGFTQVALAGRIGVTQASLSELERKPGSGSFKMMFRIARALDVDLDDLAPAGEKWSE